MAGRGSISVENTMPNGLTAILTAGVCRRTYRSAVVAAIAFASIGYISVTPLEAQRAGRPYAEAPAARRFSSAIEEARTLVLDYMDRDNAPGVSIAVMVHGEVIWSEGQGLADVEQRVSVTPVSRFRGGSVAKPMTAAALALLVEQGLIDLDQPARDYVPSLPIHWQSITVRQLAGHLSGIRHYARGADGNKEYLSARTYRNVLESLDVFRNDSLLFEPGTRYSYSTYGYNTLSAVIEAVAGTDFLTYMHDNVFRPLAMRSTTADHADSIIPFRVRFYEHSGGGPSHRTRESGWDSDRPALMNAAYTDNSYKWAGGGFLTTPEDLIRFAAAYMQPGFLKQETLDLVFTPMTTEAGETTGYGLGWNVGMDDVLGRRTFGHGGGSAGGTTSLVAYPDEEVIVAIQVNLTSASLGGLSGNVARLFIRDLENGAARDSR